MSEMPDPTISVVMAAYNGAALVRETLASLAAQTFTDFEIIAVDDKSTDDTLAVLRAWDDPRLTVIAAEENGGPVRARNRAVAAARGRYIAALDQDDLCRPERFAKQVAYLDTNPDTVLLGTAAVFLENGVIGPSTYAPLTTPGLTRWLLQIENPLVWSSVMLRADVARELDPFTRPDILYAEDFDLYHRLSRRGAIARLDEELLVYRIHPGGASQRYEMTMEASAKRVLTEAYATILGEDSAVAAGLIVDHMMRRKPVADRATLAQLGGYLVRLQEDHYRDGCTQADSRLIHWETARRWAKVARASLRAGTITLADAIAVRPPHMGLGHAGMDELLWSRLIGTVRAAKRRKDARQTFAA